MRTTRSTTSRRLALCALACALVCAAAPALALAAAATYVIDEAGIIPADIAAQIEAIGHELYVKTDGAQVAVVTAKSLNGKPIEQVGLTIARELGVGDKKTDRGVVIIIAPKEREMRLEVGYGAEGAIPDAKAGAILDEMKPYFKKGEWGEGILTGYKRAAAALAADAKVEVKGTEAPKKDDTSSTIALVVVVGILLAIWAVSAMARRKRGGGGGGESVLTGIPASMGDDDDHDDTSSGSSWGGSSSGGDSFGGGDFGGGGASDSW